jgi:outer membrane protein assembly factor BamB
MSGSTSVPAALAILLVLIGARHAPAGAQDWPQWRGPGRDGRITAFQEPEAWPAQLTRAWQVTVGTGHSSPLVVGRRVYLLSRQNEQEVVSCLDLETGTAIWRDSYPAPYTVNPAASRHGKGPKSTPVLQGGTIFTLGIGGILSAYDAESGRLRWRREFASEYPKTSPLYGAAMSPLVEGGRLIAHVGGHDNGALCAFDVETGKTVWSWTGDGPGYSSPIAAEFGGTRQIVTQSQKQIIGVSPADGRLLWSLPFTTAYQQNSVTPVVHGDTVIVSGLDNGVSAYRVTRVGSTWHPEKAWENRDVSFYMNTPVLAGGTLYGLSHRNKGSFVALDAATGATRWAAPGRAGDNAAVLVGGETLFLLTTDAELIVSKASPAGFDERRRYTVAASPTWAHPVVTRAGILVKDAETLALWRLQ